MNYADLSEAYVGSYLDRKIKPEYSWSKGSDNTSYDEHMQKELHLQAYVEDGKEKEIPSSKCTTFQYHLQDCPACREKLTGLIDSAIYSKVDYNQYTGTSPPTNVPHIPGPIPNKPYDETAWDRGHYQEMRPRNKHRIGKNMWKLKNIHLNPVFWMLIVLVLIALFMGVWFGWRYRASFMK